MANCTVTGTVKWNTLPKAGVTVYARIEKTGEVQFTEAQRVTTSDAAGLVTFDLPQSCIAYIEGEFQCGATNFNVQGGVALTIPAAASATLESLSAAVTFPSTGAVVQDDGVALANPISTFNFGTGLTAVESSPGVVDVDATGGGALDADLTAIAGLDSATAGAIASDGAGWIKKTYAAFKTALGLVKADVGLGSVDNTADADKPVSTAAQTALNLKANLAGGNSFTGNQNFGGHIFFTDNTFDIGAAAATRPRDVYIAGRALIGTGTIQTAVPLTLARGSGGTAPNVLARLMNTGVGVGDNAVIEFYPAGLGQAAKVEAAAPGGGLAEVAVSTVAASTSTERFRVLGGTPAGVQLNGTSGPKILTGTNTPESAVTAPVGSLFLRTNGGANTTLYVKESGAGNTGWIAK